MRGTPTIGGGLLAGATQLVLANANGTLKAGDIIGIPGQLLMVAEDASSITSQLTVNVEPPVRANHNSGTAVTWNQPKTLWVPRSNVAGPFPFMQNKVRPGFAIELMEAWL